MRNLITAQEVIDLAFAENSNMMADSIPDTAIRIAEIKYIRPAFGVMYPLLADKYADFTNDYVKPALAYFVKCEIVSSIAIDMSNSGVAIANPQYQSAATDKQRQRLYDSEMSKAKTLLDFALEYIATHSESFPDFSGEAPKKHHRLGGLLLGDVGVSRGQSVSITGDAFKAEFDKYIKEMDETAEEVEQLIESTGAITEEAKKATNNANIATESANKATEEAEQAAAQVPEMLYKSTTYSDLRILKNEGKLIAGAFYRITDYECVTNQPNSRSANHQFDIIVQAIDERTLSENAHAIHHDGDTYFANSKLNAWRLKYAFDADIARFNWADSWDSARPQSWETKWGVLESKDNTDASNNYTTAIVDGKTKYLYRPNTPTSYLDDKEFYRLVEVGSITSSDDLTYEADSKPYGEDGDFYWDEVYEIRVTTADGILVATLDYSWDGDIYYDREDYDHMYPLSFNPNPVYDEEKDVYIYSSNSGVESWFEDFKDGSIIEYGKEIYNGSTDSLYYAFSNALPQTSSQPRPEIYSTETGLIYQSDNWNDYVTYKSRIVGAKGVIYRMVDEWGNDCPYDFKNIEFYREVGDTPWDWYYTFHCDGKDVSLQSNRCLNNYIAPAPSNGIVNLRLFNFNVKGSGNIHHNSIYNHKSLFLSGSSICNNTLRCSHEKLGTMLADVSGKIDGNNILGAYLSIFVGMAGESATFCQNSIFYNASARASYIDCSVFEENTLELRSNTYVDINTGTFRRCRIKAVAYIKVESILQDCSITANGELEIKYGKTTSDTAPLKNLIINGKGTINIASTFPVNSQYTLNCAYNSSGTLKMWCDADLVQ